MPGYCDCESLCRYDCTTGNGQIQARYVNLGRVLILYAGNYPIPGFVEPKMAWVEAIAHCKGEGGKLVEIDSEEENTALVEEMKRRGFKDRNFWMGLTDKKDEGNWRLGSELSYCQWATREPKQCKWSWSNEYCWGGRE